MSAQLQDAASLPTNTTLAHYRIVGRIGSGGMGEVYKAVDSRLGREVALKVLRPELVHDPEKLRRFAQEAKAASALNHPAIVAIYDVASGVPSSSSSSAPMQYIAMEYVDGPSLREFLDDNVPLPKLLELIARVADGMAKAHNAGVIHRDLKPDNIVLTADRQPKIVDFGLAKLSQPDLLFSNLGDGVPTLTLPQSREGAVMGTVGYMSPEQVQGRTVDQRTDVFSLGCILFEAVTHRTAFDGRSAIDIRHQIINVDPPSITSMNPDAPEDLDRIVRRCLAKDPEDRYQSIKEVAIELRHLGPTRDEHADISRSKRWRIALVSALGLSVVGALGARFAAGRDKPASLPAYRFTPFSTEAEYEGFPAWSPDGKSIAYVAAVDGVLQVFVKGIDAAQATQITTAVADCRAPFWDPRGNRIFYISLAGDRDTLWSVGVGGGAPEVFLTNVYAAAISPDRRTLAIVRETSEQGNFALSLWIASPPDATPKRRPLPSTRSQYIASGFLRFSPDGTKIGLWAANRVSNPSNYETRDFWIVPRDGGEPYIALPSLSVAPRPYPFDWLPDSRHILFGADFMSDTPGMHLYSGDTATGKVEPLTRTAGNEYYPSVSPDGSRIVYSSEEVDFDLIRIAADGSPPTPFLATSQSEKDPVWSPTKDEYAYITNRSGTAEIWLASGNGEWRRPIATAQSFDGPTFLLANLAYSPDGQRVAYQRRGVHNYHIWISPVAGGPAVELSENLSQYEDSPTWSPDGNWIAFVMSHSPGTDFSLARMKVGAGSQIEIIRKGIIFPSNPQWSPRGDWITVDQPDGFSIVSPDGSKTRILSEHSWIVHTWARDGASIYGIRSNDDRHLVMARIDVATGTETVITDLGTSAAMITPVEGLTSAGDGKSFLTSLPHLKGDLWMIDGYEAPKNTLLTRIRSRF
jgi:serine/threonine protein kinase/Tol biopolymer transport system component